jgi:hypothetical protein
MATSFNSFSNPQQLATYQQTQPGSGGAGTSYTQQPLVSTQKPLGEAEDEDFYSRLRRTQSAQTTAQSAPAPAPTSAPTAAGAISPVASNGRLTTAPAQVAPPPAPAPQTAPAVTAPPLQQAPPAIPASAGPNPFAAHPAGGVWTGQQWVPGDHPLAKQPGAIPATPAQSGQPATPAVPYQGYQQAPTMAPLPQAHAPQQFTQWGGFDEGQQGQLQQDLINRILQNPHTMNDQAVAQLKEKQKESAHSIMAQTQGAADSRAAARGVLGGGAAEGQNRQIASDFGQHLMGAYRDIDLGRLQQDRADELSALEMSDVLMGSRFGRANEGYRNTLAGQDAQEQANQFASDYGLRRGVAETGFAMDAWNNDQNRLSDTSQFNQSNATDNRRIDVQDRLGQGGLDLDARRIAEQGRQFDASHKLDFLNYLQRGDHFNDEMGLNWERLNSDNTARWFGML